LAGGCFWASKKKGERRLRYQKEKIQSHRVVPGRGPAAARWALISNERNLSGLPRNSPNPISKDEAFKNKQREFLKDASVRAPHK
jgi:hypothetical protein